MAKHGKGIRTRDSILLVAAELFADNGYHGTATRDIAQKVGIKQPSLFTHFESKAAIMMELQRRAFEPSLRVLQLAASTDADPIARLFAALYVDVRQIVNAPFDVTGAISPTALSDPTFEAGRKLWDRIISLQEQLIEAALADGRLSDVKPSFANRVVAWLIEGVVADMNRGPGAEPDEVADQLSSFVISALLRNHDDLHGIRQEGLRIAAQLALRTEPLPD